MGLFDSFQKRQYEIGDTVRFGTYFFENEQDVKPIEWIVLDSNEAELLLLSKYCLDTVPYGGPAYRWGDASAFTWEHSYLRNWLNGDFYNRAFSQKEKKSIIASIVTADDSPDPIADPYMVFPLSESHVMEFLPDSEKRKGFPTPYAKQRGAGAGCDLSEEAVWWWVMPTKQIGVSSAVPGIVNQDGYVQYHSRLIASPGSQHATVRPAIRIEK